MATLTKSNSFTRRQFLSRTALAAGVVTCSFPYVGRVLGATVRVATGTTDRWVDCEPSTRQRVYFGNHSSHLDIIILWASLPHEVRQLARPVAARTSLMIFLPMNAPMRTLP